MKVKTEGKLQTLSIQYEGQIYKFKTTESKYALKKWFNDVVKNCRKCGSCGKLIFPGSRVGKIYGRITHLNHICCEGGDEYGYLTKDGEIIEAIRKDEM